MATVMDPIHPGEVLHEDFLIPLGVTQHRLAVSIGVPPRRINEIVHGKRRITADTALRLVTQKMSESMGQPVLVEPQTVASGVGAAQIVMRAPADGHTLQIGRAHV